MALKIINYSSPNILPKVADLCLRNELYVPYWSFRVWLSNPNVIQSITVATFDGEVVGCAILRKTMDYHCGANSGVFVKESFRLKGIGRALMDRMKKYAEANDLHIKNGLGILGSHTFFEKTLYKVVR